MKKTYWWLGIILSLGVIVYVLLNLDLREVGRTFQSLNFSLIGLAFLLYLVNYILRALRFSILLDLRSTPFLQLLGVTNLYGMYLYLLPAKFGEVTFPILLKRQLDVDISKSTGTLIVARLYDFLTITLFLGVVLIIYWMIFPSNLRIISVVFCCVVLLVFVLFLWMVRNPSRIFPLFDTGTSPKSLSSKVRNFLSGVYQGALEIEASKQYYLLLVVTIGIWLCINGNFLLITLALGYSFNFFQIVVVSMIMVPVTLFPVQGFANLGAHEIGWVTAFSMFGYSSQSALKIAISSHVVYVFFVIVLGLLGFLLLALTRISSKKSN